MVKLFWNRQDEWEYVFQLQLEQVKTREFSDELEEIQWYTGKMYPMASVFYSPILQTWHNQT